MTSWLVARENNFCPNIAILNIIRKVFHCSSFFTKRSWSKNHEKEKYLTFSLTLWNEKICSKEPLYWSSLRTVETKPISFYMIYNVLYETNVTGLTKLLKAHVKIRSFSMVYCKREQKKFVSYKTSVGWVMQYNVNARMILFHYIYGGFQI